MKWKLIHVGFTSKQWSELTVIEKGTVKFFKTVFPHLFDYSVKK